MFTADAAAKHGHEFSRAVTAPIVTAGPGTPLQNGPMRLPRPLSVLPRARQQHLTFRPRPQSMKVTMAELKEDPEGEQADEDEELRMLDAKIRSFTIPGAFQDTPPSSTRNSSDNDVKIAGSSSSPSPDVSDRDVPAVKLTSVTPSSSGEDGSDVSQVRRNVNRPKVVYRIGRPVCGERKHYLRPKCLLQIQEAAGGKFHRPVFDVVPGSRFNPRTKIGQKLRKLKRNKDGTGADDLVIVRSEHHTRQEDTEDSDEKEVDHEHETLNGQEVIGTIQPAEDGPSAYISIGDTIYKAILDNNGFSYSLQDANDNTKRGVRWFVPRAKRAAAQAGAPREFSFTSLQTDSTRHPILASMSEGHLEFYEDYASPSDPVTNIHTDEAMRKLLVVSGMWVYFCEGWSKHYDFNTATATSTRPVPGRSQSMRSATYRGIRDVLRSPSLSPCPSIRRASDMSCNVDTRSREGSHDSTATSNAMSPPATIVRHSLGHTSTSASTENPTRPSSPEVRNRGRRRWSATFTTHMRWFNNSARHSTTKEQPHMDTVITADLLHVEDLPAPVVIEEHPLRKAFIKPSKRPKSIILTDVRPRTRDGLLVPPLQTDTPKSPVLQPPIKLTITSLSSSEDPSPPQLDGAFDSPISSHKPIQQRFGLEDLARPCELFTPRHQRAESSSSSDLEIEHAAGWWSQYDRLALKSPRACSIPIV